LGLNDFLRSMTVQELSPDGLRAIGATACTLAAMERLDAHANAVALRLAALDAGVQG
jgi:histidinol dehydrogenase